ncbi:MAG: nicotinamide riboside transporter PnuC [Pseudomonadota bacterium]
MSVPWASAAAALEWTAVLLAIAYLALAIRQSILCWLCGGTSSAIYAYLTYDAGLSMQALLNLFYVGMAIYGYWQWRGGQRGDEDLPVSVWSWRVHRLALSIIAVAAAGTTFVRLNLAPDALLPVDVFADSAITFAALWTTFLVTRKELANWAYWFVIDIATIVLLIRQDLETAALPFAVYLVMIPFGYRSWRRSYATQTVAA